MTEAHTWIDGNLVVAAVAAGAAFASALFTRQAVRVAAEPGVYVTESKQHVLLYNLGPRTIVAKCYESYYYIPEQRIVNSDIICLNIGVEPNKAIDIPAFGESWLSNGITQYYLCFATSGLGAREYHWWFTILGLGGRIYLLHQNKERGGYIDDPVWVERVLRERRIEQNKVDDVLKTLSLH